MTDKPTVPRKIKRTAQKAQGKLTNLLVIPKTKYIGSFYSNGITFELTEDHCLIKRASAITVIPNGTANYVMIRYIFENSLTLINTPESELTEDQKYESRGIKGFLGCFVITDFAGEDIEHAIDLLAFHFNCLNEKAKVKMDETVNDVAKDVTDFQAILDVKNKMNASDTISDYLSSEEPK